MPALEVFRPLAAQNVVECARGQHDSATASTIITEPDAPGARTPPVKGSRRYKADPSGVHVRLPPCRHLSLPEWRLR